MHWSIGSYLYVLVSLIGINLVYVSFQISKEQFVSSVLRPYPMARSLTQGHKSIGSPSQATYKIIQRLEITDSQNDPFQPASPFKQPGKTIKKVIVKILRITEWTMFDSFPVLKFGEKQWVAIGSFMAS